MESEKNSKTRKVKRKFNQIKQKKFKTPKNGLNQVTNQDELPISESPAFLEKKLDPQKFCDGHESEDMFSDEDMPTTTLTHPPGFENLPPALDDTSDDELLPPTPPSNLTRR